MALFRNTFRGKNVWTLVFVLGCMLLASLVSQWYGIFIFQDNKILQRHLRALKYNFKSVDDGSSWDSSQCTDLDVIKTVINSPDDLKIFEHLCERVHLPVDKENQPELCKSCRYKEPVFMNTSKPFVALASFYGAGNSWTRELLEALTGIYTGSIYNDLAGDFKGSTICPHSGGVYIIKTHAINFFTKRKDCQDIGADTIDYSKAIHILRNPYEAILSTFNLLRGKSKTGFADRDEFTSERWAKYTRQNANFWAMMTQYWTQNFTRPTYVLVYERLKTDTYLELYRLSKFLDLHSTYLDLFCAKNCMKPKYHRADKPEWMDISTLYDKEQKQFINNRVIQLAKKIQKTSGDLVPVLTNYIQILN